jgi:hypothetical protein
MTPAVSALLSNAARLLGVLPNDEEVKAYGVERKGK